MPWDSIVSGMANGHLLLEAKSTHTNALTLILGISHLLQSHGRPNPHHPTTFFLDLDNWQPCQFNTWYKWLHQAKKCPIDVSKSKEDDDGKKIKQPWPPLRSHVPDRPHSLSIWWIRIWCAPGLKGVVTCIENVFGVIVHQSHLVSIKNHRRRQKILANQI